MPETERGAAMGRKEEGGAMKASDLGPFRSVGRLGEEELGEASRVFIISRIVNMSSIGV
jgi:hypothetical protein